MRLRVTMRLTSCALIFLLHFLTPVHCAITSASSFTPSDPDSDPSTSTPTSRTLFTHQHSTGTTDRPATTTPHSLQIFPPHPPHEFPTHSSFFPYEPPNPTRTRPPDRQRNDHPMNSQKPIVIFFEVFCGILAVVLLYGLLRCFYSYQRTPNRDRIMIAINRYRLQREMDEIAQRQVAAGRTSYDPVPPYYPKPPSYVERPLPTPISRDNNYTEVMDGSPPGSPTFRTPRNAAEQPDQISIPQRPNG